MSGHLRAMVRINLIWDRKGGMGDREGRKQAFLLTARQPNHGTEGGVMVAVAACTGGPGLRHCPKLGSWPQSPAGGRGGCAAASRAGAAHCEPLTMVCVVNKASCPPWSQRRPLTVFRAPVPCGTQRVVCSPRSKQPGALLVATMAAQTVASSGNAVQSGVPMKNVARGEGEPLE